MNKFAIWVYNKFKKNQNFKYLKTIISAIFYVILFPIFNFFKNLNAFYLKCGCYIVEKK